METGDDENLCVGNAIEQAVKPDAPHIGHQDRELHWDFGDARNLPVGFVLKRHSESRRPSLVPIEGFNELEPGNWSE